MNTVLLNGFIVGIYKDYELNDMLRKLSKYYGVSKSQFIVTKQNPFEKGLVKVK